MIEALTEIETLLRRYDHVYAPDLAMIADEHDRCRNRANELETGA